MSQENTTSKQPLIRYVNRQQMSWRAVDVEQLISEDHPARAIWTLVGRLDLRRFYENIESSAEEGGRPAIDPQLLEEPFATCDIGYLIWPNCQHINVGKNPRVRLRRVNQS